RVRLLSRDEGDFVTVVIPEVLVSKSWIQFVRRRRALFLKSALLFEPGVVVRHVVLVPVSGVHDATVRAVVYAKSFRPTHVEGLYFTGDPEEAEGVVEAWHERG